MTNFVMRVFVAGCAVASISSAWAIHIEPDQPDLQNPKTQLVAAGSAAETALTGGTTSISSSGFTGFNTNVIKRKPFPPGFGRSGYEFEDEVLSRTPPQPETDGPEAADQPASLPPTAKP